MTLYSADSKKNLVKVRTGNPKTARNQQFCEPQSRTGVNFPKYFWGLCAPGDCSCSIILRFFFSAASDGVTAERRI